MTTLKATIVLTMMTTTVETVVYELCVQAVMSHFGLPDALLSERVAMMLTLSKHGVLSSQNCPVFLDTNQQIRPSDRSRHRRYEE
jgi:hypothetical protein